jgi:hypothetical protein
MLDSDDTGASLRRSSFRAAGDQLESSARPGQIPKISSFGLGCLTAGGAAGGGADGVGRGGAATAGGGGGGGAGRVTARGVARFTFAGALPGAVEPATVVGAAGALVVVEPTIVLRGESVLPAGSGACGAANAAGSGATLGAAPTTYTADA